MLPNLHISYSIKNDADLWIDFKGGDKSALDWIYNEHVPYLISYGNKLTSNNSLVDDCIQDLFVDLWLKRSRLSDINQIRYYLIRGLKRRIIRNLSKSDRNKCFSDVGELFLENSLLIATAKQDVEQLPFAELQKALVKLSNLQREVIYLKYYTGIKIDDIRDLLDMNKKQVYNALSKAMVTLKKHLIK